MAHNLGEIFSRMVDLVNDSYGIFDFGPYHDDTVLESISVDYDKIRLKKNHFDDYLKALSHSDSYKCRVAVENSADLPRITAAALILSDIVILTGYGRGGTQIELLSPELFPIALGAEKIPNEPTIHEAYIQFFSDSFANWCKDARNFIEDGRLVYVPTRAIYSLGQKGLEPIKQVDPSEPWVMVDSLSSLKTEGSDLVISKEKTKKFVIPYLELMSSSFSFIEGISLELLHKVMADLEDELISFRKVISDIFPKYLESVDGNDQEINLKHTAAEIRLDLIDPAIAKLNIKLKKAIATRSLRIAGASIGTIGLISAAIATPEIHTIISKVLGAAGVGAICKECAGYREDLWSIKEDPWYFAWYLKKMYK